MYHQYLAWLPTFYKLLAASVVLFLLIKLGYLILRWRWLRKRQLVTLELTPPANIDKTPEATQRLFTVLHGLKGQRSLIVRVLGRNTVLSLEIVSSLEQGIRYQMRVEQRLSANLQQTIHAYLPEVKIKEIKEPPLAATRVATFKQTGHYAFPLIELPTLFEHDPVAYLANSMTKLETDEKMAFQMVIEPVRLKEASLLSRRILGNEDLLSHLSSKKMPLLPAIFKFINTILFGITGAIGEMYHGSTNSSYKASQKDVRDRVQVAKRLRPARTLSAFELELMESMHHKLSQPLFKVSIRATVQSANMDEVKSRLAALASSLEAYGVPSYQALRVKRALPKAQTLRRLAFHECMPTFLPRNSLVLSASEIAGLFHFPHTTAGKTENVVKAMSKSLPAPVSLKGNPELDIVFGENHYHGSVTPIGLTTAERERHVYIIGGTGNGKTTMLLYGIVQDIKRGKGLAVLDPHGDLAETILHHIPEERIEDVIYLNPDDLAYPIGINLLEMAPGLEGDDLLREKDLITESTISVMRKMFSDDDSGGHRIEYVLRNTIQTALTLEGSTLFTVFRLLNDAKFRRGVTKSLEDKDLKAFWDNELGKAGEFQRVKMVAGITAKVGRFLFSASAKKMLEQEKSTIDFDNILDSGKILICNFSKGLLGEDTSTLFGTTILAKLQIAALRRARQKQAERQPFYLYVDEFQNFATMSFVQMLSEARKYKLFLTMAEQSTAQQHYQRLVDVILANVGTVICFRSGSPADERYVLPLFYPYIEQGEIANLPAYNFYMRIAAIDAQEPLSGTTLLLRQAGDELIAQQVIEHSRKVYGVNIIAVPAIETPEPKAENLPVKTRRQRKRRQIATPPTKIQDTAPTT